MTQVFHSVAIALSVALSISSLVTVRPSHAQVNAQALSLEVVSQAQTSKAVTRSETQKQTDENLPSSDDATANEAETEAEVDEPVGEVEAEIESTNDESAEGGDISNEELSQFADVLLVLESLQDSYRARSIAAVQDIGLTLERFDQILVLTRSPDAEGAADIPEASSEETEQFQLALIQIGTIQNEIQEQAQQAIVDEGFAVERFQQIADAVNADPDLQDEVRQLMEMNRSNPS